MNSISTLQLILGTGILTASGSTLLYNGNSITSTSSGTGIVTQGMTGNFITSSVAVKITGSSNLTTANFSGIGGAGVILSGTSVLISGGFPTFYFSKTAGLTNPDGIPSGNYTVPVFRSNVQCTVTGISINRLAGSGASLMAYKNVGGTTHLASNLSASSTGAWLSSGTITNSSYTFGDALYVTFSSISGLPTAISAQIDFSQP